MPVGSTQNLNEGGTEALHALIKSLSPEVMHDGDKLTPEQVKKLSDKLKELLGEGGHDGPAQNINEGGNAVNSEGLPIIEITEPLPNADPPTPNIPIDESEFVPLASLTPSERERRRAERDRILDYWEEEERREKLKGEEQERETRREDVQKRKAALQFEVGKLKAAKEMQKKMGKALLRSMENEREKEQKAQEKTLASGTGAQRKSVRFVDPSETVDWGDVTPATLSPTHQNTLIAKAKMEKHQVLKDVLERVPPGLVDPQPNGVEQRDSDDDSDLDPVVVSDSDGDDPAFLACDDEESSSNSDEDKESLEVDEEGCDIDEAQHQRDMALEYYRKRGIIGKDVSKALSVHMSQEVQSDWNQPEVPLDATLSSPPPKPPISRFKASRIASTYDTSSPSTSLSSLVPSVVTSKTLQKSIRTGKLEGDQLVCPIDSASENEDEAIKEVLESLKKGDIRPPGNNPPLSSSSSHSTQPGPSPVQVGMEPNHRKTKGAQPSALLQPSSKLPGSSRATKHSSSAGLRFKPRKIPPRTGKQYPHPSGTEIEAANLPADSRSVTSPPTASTITREHSKPPSTLQLPVIIDSPSFPPPDGISPFSTAQQSNTTTRRLDRPPEVFLSSAVRESNDRVPQTPAISSPRRVSRFKAERM